MQVTFVNYTDIRYVGDAYLGELFMMSNQVEPLGYKASIYYFDTKHKRFVQSFNLN